jgi:putative membrane protein
MKSFDRFLRAGFMSLGLCVFATSAIGATDAALTSATFVEKAAQAGMMEVEAGKVASTRAQSLQVRDFAQRMVQDHTKSSAELKTAAATARVKVPTILDAEHRATVETLGAKSGEEFDAAYVRQMVADHEKAVALFQAAAASDALDPALVGYAKKTLPTLQAHKEMADTLMAGEDASAASTPSP